MPPNYNFTSTLQNRHCKKPSKEDWEALSNRLGLKIRIAHYPPYCSKFNPIEHRVFPHETRFCPGLCDNTGRLRGTGWRYQPDRNNQEQCQSWLLVPYWGKGYCTEAVRPFLTFCFTELKLPMIYARHLIENKASGKVIQKCGFLFTKELSTSLQGKSRTLKHYELYNP